MDGGSVGTGAFFSNCLCWCRGVSGQAHRVGAAWDVSCILVLSRLPYHVLQCTWAEMGGLTLTFSLCTCPGSCSHVFTSSWVPSSTLPQWAFTLPVSDPERGTPCNLPVPGTPQHIPQPSGQGPSRPPPELQVRVAAGGREEREREEGQLP